MTGYVLSAVVEFDLDEIWEYIAADNIRCRRSLDRKAIRRICSPLWQTPGMGHRREDVTDYPVLFWRVGAYLIIYRAERRPVEIVAAPRLHATSLFF